MGPKKRSIVGLLVLNSLWVFRSVAHTFLIDFQLMHVHDLQEVVSHSCSCNQLTKINQTCRLAFNRLSLLREFQKIIQNLIITWCRMLYNITDTKECVWCHNLRGLDHFTNQIFLFACCCSFFIATRSYNNSPLWKPRSFDLRLTLGRPLQCSLILLAITIYIVRHSFMLSFICCNHQRYTKTQRRGRIRPTCSIL